ncbi:MAG TPA: hypothetical protein VF175_15655 [Lacipirellula sp.]
MKGIRSWHLAALAAALLSTASCSENAHAAFHLWAIKEVFTSADGSVQFVEFFTSSAGQEFLDPHNMVITSDGVAKTIEFDRDLPGSTANKHFLIATNGFGAISGGVTPDYTPVSGNLFDPDAATIEFNFAHDFDILTVSGSQIPKDGVNSLHDADTTPFGPDVLSTGVNTPVNFAGQAGSVNLGGSTPTPGDFNGNNIVDGADLMAWRTNFGATGTPTVSQGNANDDGDVDGRDFLVWQRNVGPAPSLAAAAAIPEPTAASLITFAALAMTARCTRRRREPKRPESGEPGA